jgi:hypothetical protein
MEHLQEDVTSPVSSEEEGVEVEDDNEADHSDHSVSSGGTRDRTIDSEESEDSEAAHEVRDVLK